MINKNTFTTFLEDLTWVLWFWFWLIFTVGDWLSLWPSFYHLIPRLHPQLCLSSIL